MTLDLENPGPLLGAGGEAEVFVLDSTRVLRRLRGGADGLTDRIALIDSVRAAADKVASPLVTPEVLDHGVAGGVAWTIERRLPGRPMTQVLAELRDEDRAALLEHYMETTAAIGKLPLERPWFGELIASNPIRTDTWIDYLRRALTRQVGKADRSTLTDIPQLQATLAQLHADLDTLPPAQPGWVHFDVYPGNVLAEGRRITAVLDWSVLCLRGDARLDLALAAAYLELVPHREADLTVVRSWLADRGLAEVGSIYRRWAAAWWLPASDDRALGRWVAEVLREAT